MIATPPRPLMNREQVAELLGVQPQTLAKWHVNGRVMLPVVYVGRSVRYRPEDVERFIEANTTGGETRP